MRYCSFRIKNFKGIKDTTVNLENNGPRVFAFVGLNESGKTTVLEAIHSFSPDKATSELVGGVEGVGVPFKDRVPRHMLSNFTGDVSVSATISLNETDKNSVVSTLEKDHNITLDLSSLADVIVFERQQSFKRGDFQKDYFSLREELKVKTGKERKWRDWAGSELEIIRDVIYGMTPDIAYFPTFVFDFPRRIYLTDRGGKLDRFYRRVFQDILDFDGRKNTIENDIVRRVRGESLLVPWLAFLSAWSTDDEKDKIQHVLDRAASVVTKVVFGRWNKIFGEDAKEKEISISFEVVEGEITESNGVKKKTNQHDISILFKIKDGTRRFAVNDRSLGFRWFFAFMLFTQFRVARSGTRPLLFLFDEPASNLHAAAQEKLIESFPEIATGENMLAYTTHSHYMIEPKWLEQTFIVTNRSDTPLVSIIDATSLDDESLDIQVVRYRKFVNDNPGKTNYFQPILDRLQIAPSRFDIKRESFVLEGKSDYYIIRYCAEMLERKKVALLPGLGAGTLGALVALQVGWNIPMFFLVDGDKKGHEERNRYVDEYGLAPERIVTLDELAVGIEVIEDLVDEEARVIISKQLAAGGKITKNQIRRFFQERLASGDVQSLGKKFEEKAKSVLEALEAKYESAIGCSLGVP